MQKKLSRGKLLDEKGCLIQAGYSTELVRRYDRREIGANKLKIKEWDYYLIYNDNYAVALTVADNSYMGMLSASVINFKDVKEKTSSIIELFTKGSYNMPSSSQKGDVQVKNKKAEFSFVHAKKDRIIKCKYDNFDGEKSLNVNLTLTEEPKESMVIAIPFDKNPKAFYYNQKIVGFKASGYVEYGEERIEFNPSDSVAILDWGRGVWTYKNTWLWSSAAGYHDGHSFGFNLGYGFGNTSAATENMLFYDGYAIKLDDVKFEIPTDKKGKYSYLEQWKVVSQDGSLNIDFKPIINRHSDTNLLVLRSNQNQVFGKFSGTVKLDNNTIIEIKDLVGFAECVFNKW